MAAHRLIRWVLDTRALWLDDFTTQTSLTLECLKADERQAVGKYRRVEDKKMSLGSYLLKYLVIARTCGVPWPDIHISGGEYKKPCYRPKDPSYPGVEFNISHQAGLVAVVAHPGTSTTVGVDIVCVNERNDLARIEENGFEAWVNMYEEMFSDRELNDIKYTVNTIQLEDGIEISADQLGDLARSCSRHEPMCVCLPSGEMKQFSSRVVVEAKLRRFYAFWCLKEAYIKMSGEALLAEWLRDLEFRNVRAPKPNLNHESISGTGFGEVVRDVEVLFRGTAVNNASIELQAFEEQYMIATATSPMTPGRPERQDIFPGFEKVDLERDIYPEIHSVSMLSDPKLEFESGWQYLQQLRAFLEMNTEDDPAPPIPSDTGDVAFADQSLRGLRDLAAISLVVVVGPLLIYAFWRFLSNWGWWRVRNAGSGDEESGRAANLRRQYVRTWHGWVEKQCDNQDHHDHEIKNTRIEQTCEFKDSMALRRSTSLGRTLRNCLRSKTATTDYNRIFWDHRTDREKEHISPRYWWQKWLNGDIDHFNNRLDEEKGVLRSASSGFNLGEKGTVRRRLGDGFRAGVWASGSDEIRRATQSQLLPARQCLRFSEGKQCPSQLAGVDNNVKVLKNITIPRRYSSLPQETVPKVQFPTPPLTRSLSAALRRPTRVLEDLDPRKTRKFPEQITPFPHILLKQRRTGEPEAPHNSLESPVSADVTPEPSAQVFRVKNRAARTHVDGSPTLTFEVGFANSLGRRLEVWASPMILDSLAPGNHGIDGTAGRRTSPAMGWHEVRDWPEALSEDLNSHEAGSSTDQSTQLSGSSSIGDTNWSQRAWPSTIGDDDQLISSVSPKGHTVRHKIPPNSLNEWGHAPLVWPIRRRASFPARCLIGVPARPDRTLHPSVSRARSVGSLRNLKHRISFSGKAEESDRYQTRSFTSSEKTFLDLLDRKLNWLHHELSPGFRCPEDNPAESFLPPSGPQRSEGAGKNAQVRVSGALGGGSMPTRTSKARQQKRARHRIPNPKVDSWRIAINKLRKGTHRTNSAELLCTILQTEEITKRDPIEGSIDTAAWILRRPPQGWPTASKGSLSAAEKMIVKHQDWEKIRRPQRIMKQRHSRRNTTRLRGKISGRVLKTLRIGDNTTFMRETVGVSEQSRRATSETSEVLDENLLELQLTPRLRLHANRPILGSECTAMRRNDPMARIRSLGLMEWDGLKAVSKGHNPYTNIRGAAKPQVQRVEVGQVPVVALAAAGDIGAEGRNAACLIWGEEGKSVFLDGL
ncbi:hypothetical protein FGG08_005116 [Glutinoglossum americanum]|uniref:holo-[acyl-carrier-protein] synthase n=1 Tax=Glutinoglossum americanum TaxID=1670608 RepID=A0A9P8HYV9_9PEZI|nr:hypothetical protein FGG08_005116 [Glutinoglossum americanum]